MSAHEGRFEMQITTITANNVKIARIRSTEILITDVQSVLDLIGTVGYETLCERILLDKAAIAEEFFNLRSGLAGAVSQKFINYRVKVAIVGDFSIYESKSLQDFIRESNEGKDLFFLPDEQQAADRLSKV
ncbi:DUF4180 domain-containing protein [Cohnella boryungensis]|uniref:DUF4180 domain-containing protein n=2 Tax=Cohnella boryungensis TaxID=768479 RepID=A0ABV8SIZ8_9BACL